VKKAESGEWNIGPVAILVAGLLFMENLDASVLPTAGICVTAYLVTVVVLIPVSAWLVEKWGARIVLFSAITIFTGASVLCALSNNLTELTMMRVLQGVGGAMMVPVGRLVVLRSTNKQNIIRAISYLTWPALMAPVIAPALSGVLITYASWPWIFLINLPLGVVALIIAIRIIPHTPHGQAGKLDWLGFYGASISLGSFVIGAALLGKPSVPFLPTVALFVIGVSTGIPTVRHLMRSKAPLVGLEALRIGTFRAASSGGAFFRIGINAVPFLLPLLFQDKFGWSPARAGGMVLLLFAGNFMFKPFTTPLLRLLRFRTVLIIDTAVTACTVAVFAFLRSTTPITVIALTLIVSGMFRSLGYTSYNTITFADIEQPMMRQANSLANMIQQLTTVFAIALAVVSLKIGRQVFGIQYEYSFAFFLLSILILFAAIGAFRLPRLAGDSIRQIAETP
jgi:hypothetical protein